MSYKLISVFLPDLEQRLKANPAEQKRIQEEIGKFKDVLEKDKELTEKKKSVPKNPNETSEGKVFD